MKTEMMIKQYPARVDTYLHPSRVSTDTLRKLNPGVVVLTKRGLVADPETVALARDWSRS